VDTDPPARWQPDETVSIAPPKRPAPRTLIVMAGLPGTGKSTVARALEKALPAVVLDKDRIRAALFPPPEIEYSTKQDDFCMRIMLQVAEYLLQGPGKRVILDGRTFSSRYQIDAVRGFAQRLRIPCRVIECVCADRTARKRLERDLNEGRHPATNRTYKMYLGVKAHFEPIAEPKLVVNTDDPLEFCVQRALEYIQQE
jgi:predicted kinase